MLPFFCKLVVTISQPTFYHQSFVLFAYLQCIFVFTLKKETIMKISIIIFDQLSCCRFSKLVVTISQRNFYHLSFVLFAYLECIFAITLKKEIIMEISIIIFYLLSCCCFLQIRGHHLPDQYLSPLICFIRIFRMHLCLSLL